MHLKYFCTCVYSTGSRCELLSDSDGNPSRRVKNSEGKPVSLLWTDCLILCAIGYSVSYSKSGLPNVQAHLAINKFWHRYHLSLYSVFMNFLQ